MLTALLGGGVVECSGYPLYAVIRCVSRVPPPAGSFLITPLRTSMVLSGRDEPPVLRWTLR